MKIKEPFNLEISPCADTARELFEQDYNCAQAVFGAFVKCLGEDNSDAMAISSPFGGGIARRGMTCGAVTGALMAIGYYYKSFSGSSSPASKNRVLELSTAFCSEFEKKHGSLICKDLIKTDLMDNDQRLKAKEAGIFKSVCAVLVNDAGAILDAMTGDADS